MPKENMVLLHGQVQIAPKIYMDKDKNLTKAVFALKTLRRPYYNGQLVANRLYFDCPVIFTRNAEMIQLAASLEKDDMVDVRGVITTQEVVKSTICSSCSHKNSAPGNMVYITPLYICRRETAVSPEKGLELLKQRNEVSNLILVIGTLCRDPEFYTDERNHTSAQYQLAVNRKYRIREDLPDIRTDYPWVKTHGPQALKDAQYIKTGSVVYINGCLQTRDVLRTTVCEACGTEYTWMDSAMEIVPYATEYLAGCDYPEPASDATSEEDDVCERSS